MSSIHILIVEDEQEIAEVLRDYMVNEGYAATLLDKGDKVIPFVKKENPSLILLDLMLPGLDGITICREIRKFSTVPILMITAKVDEIDRILGIELGADDYICKPFSPREVVARVKAVLRRTLPAAPEVAVAVGPVKLNAETRQVTVNTHELDLTPSEYDILEIMIAYPNRVFTRAQLIDRVQGYSYEGYERTIDFHIKNLRKKIAAHYSDPKIIQSVYGVGYKLVIADSNG